mmetsp:Transcript_3930/g.5751  ORF Transcript_3930/g.5751 Transcript_3930/m.5751 type:complete len:81 (-) Transcript_3930:202-444(-)
MGKNGDEDVLQLALLMCDALYKLLSGTSIKIEALVMHTEILMTTSLSVNQEDIQNILSSPFTLSRQYCLAFNQCERSQRR